MANPTRRDDSLASDRPVVLHAGWVTAVFGVVIFTLALAHVVFQSVKYHLGMPEFYGMVRLFDMGVEANLPTFFSGFQLLIVSLLLFLVGLKMRQSRDLYARHWLFLAFIFFAMAADEIAEIHEMSIRPLHEIAPGLMKGLLFWSWVIPALVLVLVVCVSYARFVFSYLPPAMRNATLIGAAIFVGGAVGVEMPEAMFVEKNGLDNFTYALFVLVEETMEMGGILVFLSGLLSYIGSHVGLVAVRVVASPGAAKVIERPRLRQRPAL